MLKKDTTPQRGLHYRFYGNATTFPAKDWNAVNVTNNLVLSIPYLKILENTLVATLQFQYILFYNNQIPVAIAVTQQITFPTETIQFQQFPCRISDAIGTKISKNLEIKVLLCGNLFSCGEYGFKYTDHLPAKEAFLLLAKALRKLRKAEQSEKPSFILLKEFWPTSLEASTTILAQDYRAFEIDVNMVLPIAPSWNTFEDYLTSMKTKFRTRAKSVFKKSASQTAQDFSVSAMAQHQNEINTLYLSVIQNAAFNIEKLNAHTFQGLKTVLKERFILTGYFLDKTLIGFTTAFVLDDAIAANHIGINSTYNKSHALYERMPYDYAQLAISKKVKTLRLGRTAELIKSSIGAQLIPMKLNVRHGNSISNTLLKPLVEFITSSNYEIRNPFKQ